MKTNKDKKYSFDHFKKRLKERYELDITEDEYDNICSMMELYKTFPPLTIEKQKNDIQMTYVIVFKEEMITVVWSETRDLLTTVLPMKRHHIWCNFPRTNPYTCKMCKRFNRDYPMDGITPDELLKKHFPDAIKKGE